MTTPAIFIFFPLIVAIILYWQQKRTSLVMITSITVCLLLFLFAFFQDFGGVWKIGPISIEIKTSMAIFGRSFSLTNQEKFFLAFVNFSAAIWFSATRIARLTSRFIPLAMAIISILTSALAVEPFLYSAILVEIAVLVSIPLILQPGKPTGRGILRFLVYQSLAMPLILFGGWLLGGIQASPSDTTRLLQSVLFLGIGFVFWLGVVPFQSWVPQFSQDIQPLISGFILGLFPIVTMLIMLDFISGLVWLRESQYLQPILGLIGTIMVVSTSLWAMIERDGRRLLGYSILLESGFALLAVSLQSEISVKILFISFIPRMGAIALMALSLSIFSTNGIIPNLDNLKGMLRKYPFASIALITSFLSVGGSPLLGGFPSRLALFEQLIATNTAFATWALVGMIIFLFSVVRLLQYISQPVYETWARGETLAQTIFLVIGMVMLILFGILPNLFGEQLASLFMNLPILR